MTEINRDKNELLSTFCFDYHPLNLRVVPLNVCEDDLRVGQLKTKLLMCNEKILNLTNAVIHEDFEHLMCLLNEMEKCILELESLHIKFLVLGIAQVEFIDKSEDTIILHDSVQGNLRYHSNLRFLKVEDHIKMKKEMIKNLILLVNISDISEYSTIRYKLRMSAMQISILYAL